MGEQPFKVRAVRDKSYMAGDVLNTVRVEAFLAFPAELLEVDLNMECRLQTVTG